MSSGTMYITKKTKKDVCMNIIQLLNELNMIVK